MKYLTYVLAIFAFPMLSLAQRPTAIPKDPPTIRLWQGKAPGALGDAPEDIPTLTMYLPSATSGPLTAVVIMPGGGYSKLATNSGEPTARYLNALGVAAFLLNYRLGPRYHHPIELGDALRAIRTVRSRAGEWRIAPDRVGVMGFSSGGHLSVSIAWLIAMKRTP